MENSKKSLEITFFARGGQGAKTAAEVLAQAAVSEGKFVQAFPNFGPERSGAPLRAFLRVSEKEIRTHEPILKSDLVVVLDETLLATEKIAESLKKDSVVIINSRQLSEALGKRIKFSGKIFAVDASGISLDIIGQPRPNTVILGKIAKITKMVSLKSIQKEFQKIFANKIGREATEKNLQAIQKSFEA